MCNICEDKQFRQLVANIAEQLGDIDLARELRDSSKNSAIPHEFYERISIVADMINAMYRRKSFLDEQEHDKEMEALLRKVMDSGGDVKLFGAIPPEMISKIIEGLETRGLKALAELIRKRAEDFAPKKETIN